MAIDLDKLRNKLDQLKNPDAKRFNTKTWKPKKEGEKSTIRLIEYPFGDDPFVELWFHYGIGNGPGILCPKKNNGKSCPICELAIKLVESKDESDKEISKKLWPKQRMYAVVVDRDDATPAPKYWGFGTSIYQKLIEALLSPQTGHMMEVSSGIDMVVWSEKKPKKKFAETEFVLDRNDSPLAETDKEIKDIVAAITPIEEVFKPSTTSEIKKRLTDWLSFSDDEGSAEDKSSESVKGGDNGSEDHSKSTSKVSESSNAEDIDADFERALANSGA